MNERSTQVQYLKYTSYWLILHQVGFSLFTFVGFGMCFLIAIIIGSIGGFLLWLFLWVPLVWRLLPILPCAYGVEAQDQGLVVRYLLCPSKVIYWETIRKVYLEAPDEEWQCVVRYGSGRFDVVRIYTGGLAFTTDRAERKADRLQKVIKSTANLKLTGHTDRIRPIYTRIDKRV